MSKESIKPSVKCPSYDLMTAVLFSVMRFMRLYDNLKPTSEPPMGVLKSALAEI